MVPSGMSRAGKKVPHQVAVPQRLVHVRLQRLHLQLHLAHRLVLLLLQLQKRLQRLRKRAAAGSEPVSC